MLAGRDLALQWLSLLENSVREGKKKSLFVQTTLRSFQIILFLQNKPKVFKVIKGVIYRNITKNIFRTWLFYCLLETELSTASKDSV